MNNRQARKIVSGRTFSERLKKRLDKLYPPYTDENGRFIMPSFHKYYKFQKAWCIVHRKIRKYGDKFKLL